MESNINVKFISQATSFSGVACFVYNFPAHRQKIMKLTFLMLSALLCLQATAQLSDMSNWETLTDPQFFSTIRYPPDWKVDFLTEGYTITSPMESDTDRYQENISFVGTPVSDTAMQANIKDFSEANFIAMTKPLRDVHVMVHKDITTRSDMPMYLVVFHAVSNGQYLYWKQVYCLYDNVFYLITYIGEAGKKDRFAIAGGDMLNSFSPPRKVQKI